MKKVLLIFLILPQLIFASCTSMNDSTNSCRYLQGDKWCSQQKNALFPFAYNDKCLKNSYRIKNQEQKDKSWTLSYWNGTFKYKGFDMATGSVFKSDWIFKISKNSCHLTMSREESTLSEIENKEQEHNIKTIIDADCTISKATEDDDFESDKLEKSILEMDAIVVKTDDSKYLLLRERENYFISGYNVTLPRNYDYLHPIKKEKSSKLNLDIFVKKLKERSLLACQFVHENWGTCYTLYSSVESFKGINRAHFEEKTIRPKGQLNPDGIPYSQTLKPSFTYINAKCENGAVVGDLYSDELNYFGKGGQGISFIYEKIAPLLCGAPKFDSFRASDKYINSNKSLIQKDFGRLYRTLLTKALKEKKPEFGGKYLIAQWGCDEGENECRTGGIIDASTGIATEFPFKFYEHNGAKEIIYKLNSSLIIFAGDFVFKDGRREENKVLFYEFRDGEFLFLKEKEYNK